VLTGRKSQDRQDEVKSAATAATTMTIVTSGIFSLTSANCSLYSFKFTLLRDGLKEGRKKERKKKHETQKQRRWEEEIH
jgi:hypothetical protein